MLFRSIGSTPRASSNVGVSKGGSGVPMSGTPTVEGSTTWTPAPSTGPPSTTSEYTPTSATSSRKGQYGIDIPASCRSAVKFSTTTAPVSAFTSDALRVVGRSSPDSSPDWSASEIGRRIRPGTWICGKRCTICHCSSTDSDEDDDEHEVMNGVNDARPMAESPEVRNVRRVITRSS